MTLAKIVFASMTGNTEEIADIVADKFRYLGVEVEVDECTTVDAEDLSAEDEDIEKLEAFAEEVVAKVG